MKSPALLQPARLRGTVSNFGYSCLLGWAAIALTSCGTPEPIQNSRYAQSDRQMELIKARVSSAPGVVEVADIDHSRLGAQVGVSMPPARVLIFSDAALESELIELSPLVALDLPLRVLAFEAGENGPSRIIYNRFDYLSSRYQLNSDGLAALGARYDQRMEEMIADVPAEDVASFPSDEMTPAGIITIPSTVGFSETLQRVNDAIRAQDDAMVFGNVDFQANARELGVEIRPTHLILFGAPGPGGKAMRNSPTLGLDGFCQKFLIWEDEGGRINLSFNDLLALSRRQGTEITPALRVINYRLNSVFGDALSEEESQEGSEK